MVMLLGLACCVSVAAFIRISRLATSLRHWPIALRFTIAGIFTGTLALWVPEILGMGYDTLNLALGGQIAVSALLIIALCKLAATAVTCGLGMPVGLIGPNLLIGACLGGALGAAAQQLLPHSSDPVVYIVIGMGAAMGAVLNAPLAAILAVVELTGTLGAERGRIARHSRRNAHQYRFISAALGTSKCTVAATSTDTGKSAHTTPTPHRCERHNGHQRRSRSYHLD